MSHIIKTEDVKNRTLQGMMNINSKLVVLK